MFLFPELIGVFSPGFLRAGNVVETCCLMMFSTSLITLIVAAKNRQQPPYMTHLSLYLAASAVQTSIFIFFVERTYFGFYISPSFLKKTIVWFLVAETMAVYYFFYKNPIVSKAVRIILPCALVSFYVIIWRMLHPALNQKVSINDTYFVEALYILLPCFSYFIQLFKTPPILQLTNEPSFWVTSGLTIFFLLSLPMFYISKHFETDNLSVISNSSIYFGYTLVFLFILRAYLCKPKVTR
jgi:hypothetical protein